MEQHVKSILFHACATPTPCGSGVYSLPPVAPPLAGQLAWLVYLIASVIGGRVSHTLPEDYDCMDGQLVCRYGDDIPPPPPPS